MIIAVIQDRYSKKDNNNSNDLVNDSIDFIKQDEQEPDFNERLSNIDEYIKNKVRKKLLKFI